MKQKLVRVIGMILAIVLIMGGVVVFLRSRQQSQEISDAKPVIYLYPETEMEVEVSLRYNGRLTVLYPMADVVTSYSVDTADSANVDENTGDNKTIGSERPIDTATWHVTARPEGTLIDKTDAREYSYLFWEGCANEPYYDFSTGFCVSGEDTLAFLQEILPQMGLTAREYNECIVYWLPRMQENPYNIISFQTEAYTGQAQLQITPQPDQVLRVFMAWQASDHYVEMEPQEFEPFTREGFTVVEWGGAEVH